MGAATAAVSMQSAACLAWPRLVSAKHIALQEGAATATEVAGLTVGMVAVTHSKAVTVVTAEVTHSKQRVAEVTHSKQRAATRKLVATRSRLLAAMLDTGTARRLVATLPVPRPEPGLAAHMLSRLMATTVYIALPCIGPCSNCLSQAHSSPGGQVRTRRQEARAPREAPTVRSNNRQRRRVGSTAPTVAARHQQAMRPVPLLVIGTHHTSTDSASMRIL
jgi:hypothetical protein